MAPPGAPEHTQFGTAEKTGELQIVVTVVGMRKITWELGGGVNSDPYVQEAWS